MFSAELIFLYGRASSAYINLIFDFTTFTISFIRGGKGRARGLKPPLSPPRGGLAPLPKIDAVPNCSSSNKIEIL